MKWVEVIGVRATAGNREILEARLVNLVRMLQKRGLATAITVLHRVNVASDLCVHLHHDAKNPDPAGSSLGLRLAAEMEAFGLVHHSIWSQVQGSKTV